MECNCNNNNSNGGVIPWVRGNRLPLIICVYENVVTQEQVGDSTLTVNEMTRVPYTIQDNDTVTVIMKSGFRQVAMPFTTDGNKVMVTDNGELPTGAYTVEVTIERGDGARGRWQETRQVRIYENTSDAQLGEMYSIDADLFFYAKGDTGTGIADITNNPDGTLTITMTDGTTYTTEAVKGEKGDKGDTGERGVSIVSFDVTGQTDVSVIYTVTFSDDTTQDISVPKGPQGDTGLTGNGISTTTLNSDYTLTIAYTDGTTYTTPSIRGAQGAQGVSVIGFTQTGETATNTMYNLVFSDGRTQSVAIPKGVKGDKGDKGDTGATGATGAQGPKGDTVIIGDEQTYTLYGVTGQNSDGAMTQKAVTDALYNDILGKYNADDLNLNYVGGIINSSTGEINTQYSTWRTSPFLELPSTPTTITVHGVFPRNNSLGVVGCYLYNDAHIKIGYPSNIPISGSSASFTFSMNDYPTAKYIKITCYKNDGTTGDDTYITPVYIKGDRIGDLETNVETNKNNIKSISNDLSGDIPFCFKGQYIDTSGKIVNNTAAVDAYATDYISVKEGEVYEFANIGWSSPSLHHCWGYNVNKEPVSMLIGGYAKTAPFNGKITIPSGISYIKAWGNITINPSLTFLRASEIEEKIKKYEFDIIGSYINNNGTFVYNNSVEPRRTGMVKVSEGDVFVGKDLFWDGSTTLSQCWGYDSNGSPVQELVPCYPASNPFNGKITIPSGVSYICAFGRNTGNPQLYKTGSIYDDIDRAIANNVPKINYITVTPDGTNYNIIRTLLSTITDAAEDNQYVIIIPNGSYFECDLKGKKYVTLHGESKENTIIYCDGTSSNVTPSDYTIAADANKALSSVDKNNKHIFHLAADLTIENCTLQSNDVKYCIHFENSAWAKAIIKDCIFIATNNHSAIGFGLRWKQHAEFHRCEFRVTGCTNAVYTHNWDWQKTTAEHIPISGGGVLVKFEGCKFSNNGQNLLTIGEIGSFNDDKVVFVSCKTNNPSVRALVETTGNRTYHIKRDGSYETNPLLVPYCMHLDMINCGVENSITFNKSNRPDFENYCTVIN